MDGSMRRQAPGHRHPQPRNSWVWVGGSLVLARASRCTDPRRPQTSRFTHVAGDYSGRVRESQETKGGVCIPIILRTERRSQASDPQVLDRVVSRVSQLKDSINENLLDALDLLHESNSPDSTSLPPRVKLELRQRIQGGSGSFSEDKDLESLTSQNGGHKMKNASLETVKSKMKLEFQTFLDDITDSFSENGDFLESIYHQPP
ncbi:uncharacterized protein [Castor canadensis]|uniref:Uncharacterized protein n=1 Tax=Castor canadensis TaxID=51338 RepID=A0AC58LCX4_CASCN